MSKKHLRIGTGPRDYIAFRAFERMPIPHTERVRVPYLPVRALSRVHPYFSKFSHGVGYFLPYCAMDLLHSSNAILLNHSPWVVSFESTLPRVWEQPSLYRYMFRRLALKYCKKILPLSMNAKKQFELRNQDEPELSQVLKKVGVSYPGVEDCAESLQHKRSRKLEAPYKLIFIGNDFFRKGGHLVLRAFAKLKNLFPLELTVISNMQCAHPFLALSAKDALQSIHEMERLKVIHFQNVSSREVRQHLSNSDLLLLPSLQDSFGFSIVEAMATEVPTIATSIEAIPEIILDEVTGTLLSVPVNLEGRLVWSQEREEQIVLSLIAAIKRLLAHPQALRILGQGARKRYEDLFHPNIVGQHLRLIYDEAVKP